MKDGDVLDEEPDQSGLTRRYTEAAVSFIDHHYDQPFFFNLPHTFPHRPWFASDTFKGKSKRGLSEVARLPCAVDLWQGPPALHFAEQ